MRKVFIEASFSMARVHAPGVRCLLRLHCVFIEASLYVN